MLTQNTVVTTSDDKNVTIEQLAYTISHSIASVGRFYVRVPVDGQLEFFKPQTFSKFENVIVLTFSIVGKLSTVTVRYNQRYNTAKVADGIVKVIRKATI